MTLLAFDSVSHTFQPIEVKQIGSYVSDGSETADLVALAAPHDAGMYHVGVEIEVETAATTGTCQASITTSQGAVFAWAPQSITTTGVLTLPMYARQSDGLSDITVSVTFDSVTGSPDIRIRSVVL